MANHRGKIATHPARKRSDRPTRNHSQTGSYDLVNARVGIETDVFDAHIFVENLLDTKAITSITTNTSQGIYDRITTAAPRTIGVMLRKSF